MTETISYDVAEVSRNLRSATALLRQVRPSDVDAVDRAALCELLDELSTLLLTLSTMSGDSAAP